MKNTKSIALPLTGTAFGASLAASAANAAAEFLQAQRAPHPIYVDGQQVQLETYAINGSNYVKLRDIGQAVGLATGTRGGCGSDHQRPALCWSDADEAAPGRAQPKRPSRPSLSAQQLRVASTWGLMTRKGWIASNRATNRCRPGYPRAVLQRQTGRLGGWKRVPLPSQVPGAIR